MAFQTFPLQRPAGIRRALNLGSTVRRLCWPLPSPHLSLQSEASVGLRDYHAEPTPLHTSDTWKAHSYQKPRHLLWGDLQRSHCVLMSHSWALRSRGPREGLPGRGPVDAAQTCVVRGVSVHVNKGRRSVGWSPGWQGTWCGLGPRPPSPHVLC